MSRGGNTSFNVRGEPIVCTPEDAFRCFMGSDIEVLAIGNCFLQKDDQVISVISTTRMRLNLTNPGECKNRVHQRPKARSQTVRNIETWKR